VTSPDKPDTAPTDTTGDERTVATAAVESTTAGAGKAAASTPATTPPPASAVTTKPAAVKADKGTVAGTVSGTTQPASSANGTNGSKPTEPAAPTVVTSPVSPPAQATKPVSQPQATNPVVSPPPVPPVEGPDVTSTAPPPWQRVAADTQYLGVPAPDGSTDNTAGRFADWGYPRSPRSNAYGEAPTESGVPLSGGYPVVSGTAAGSVFASVAGQSGVRPDARPGTDPNSRTTVNFGAPVDPIRPPASAPSALRRPGRGPRRASLQIKRIDPWSVLKLAFVLSVALFFVWLVAVGVLYGVLQGMGVWDRVNGTYDQFVQSSSAGGSSSPLITASRVFGIAAIIGAINIVLFTALATVGSFVYNVSADLAGGLEITLAERE
jgi:Transmembrane domain of unknown function (DUF3566)